jgi:hypothetical protein
MLVDDDVVSNYNLLGKKGKMALSSTSLFNLMSDNLCGSVYTRKMFLEDLRKAIDSAHRRKHQQNFRSKHLDA